MVNKRAHHRLKILLIWKTKSENPRNLNHIAIRAPTRSLSMMNGMISVPLDHALRVTGNVIVVVVIVTGTDARNRARVHYGPRGQGVTHLTDVVGVGAGVEIMIGAGVAVPSDGVKTQGIRIVIMIGVAVITTPLPKLEGGLMIVEVRPQ